MIPSMTNYEQNIQLERKKRTNLTTETVRIIRNQLIMGYAIKDISVGNNLSMQAIRNVANKISKGMSDVEIILKKGRKNKSNFELKNQLSAIVRQDNSLTQKGIADSLLSTGIKKSQASISRLLKQANLTRKRLSLVPEERNNERVLETRVQFARDIEQTDISKLVYLDETGFNLHSSSYYGYSEQNTKAYITVPANRGINISLMCAISINGVIGHRTVSGAYNGDLFIIFINEVLVPFFSSNRNYILILDNCRFHHRLDVIRCLNLNGITYKFLPAYSPQLNPIEEFFASVKARYNLKRPRPRTRTAVESEINAVLNSINYSFNNLYNRARNFLEIALSRRHFI